MNHKIQTKMITRQGVALPSDVTSSMSFLYSSAIGRICLKLLIQPFISKLAGIFLSTKLSTIFINPFIRSNQLNMVEYKQVKYTSFNDFFSREIKEGQRPFSNNDQDLSSPADSKLSIYTIDENSTLRIKKSLYQVKDILLDQEDIDRYQGGYALVFRLAVDDYHRYSMIDQATRIKNYPIPGIFHTVNPIATYYYPIYFQNAREVTIYDTAHFGRIAYIEVGAMMVGKIVNFDLDTIEKGQIKGYFQFGGSTVVLLFEKDTIELDQDLLDLAKQGYEIKVKMGETIGHISKTRINN